MDHSDFNKNREVLKIKNYKEFVSQEKLKKPEWLKIKISPNRQTIKEGKESSRFQHPNDRLRAGLLSESGRMF